MKSRTTCFVALVALSSVLFASCGQLDDPTAPDGPFPNDPLSDNSLIDQQSNLGAAGRSSLSCVAPPMGQVSWWPGDGNAKDVRDDNNGQLNAGVGFAPGVSGKAFDFGDPEAQVTVPDNTNINFTNADSYTVDLWVKTDVVTDGHRTLIEKWSLPHDLPYPFAVRLNTDQFPGSPTSPIGTVFCAAYDLQNFPSVSSITRIDDGVFHHVACVYDHPSKQIEVYVDGQAENSITYTTLGDITNTFDVFMGARGGQNPGNAFNGLLDEVEIFNRALTADEVAGIFNAGDDRCTLPASMIQALARQVEELVAAGVLTERHGRKLTRNLRRAVRLLGKRHRFLRHYGCKELRRFVRSVHKLVHHDKLDQESGDKLISSANDIIAQFCQRQHW